MGKSKEGLKTSSLLSPEEIVFLKKLCQPESFLPTLPEWDLLGKFAKRDIVRLHRDGSIEVTEHGADCYVATVQAAEPAR